MDMPPIKVEHEELMESENIKLEKDEPEYVDLQQDYLNSDNLSDGLEVAEIKDEIKIECDNNLIQVTNNFISII